MRQVILSPPTPITRLMKSLPLDGARPMTLPMSWTTRATGLLGVVNCDSSGQRGGPLKTTISPRRGEEKSYASLLTKTRSYGCPGLVPPAPLGLPPCSVFSIDADGM